MNSLWIQRISDYRHTAESLKSAKNIILSKIEAQNFLLKKYKQEIKIDFLFHKNITSRQELLLFEARFARLYWIKYADLLSNKTNFVSRKPRNTDAVNHLLDIGYHHLTNKVKKIFAKHEMNTSLGILHKATSSKASPLAYDMIELFRADIVDTEILRFFHLKKKPLYTLSKRDIPHFLHKINLRLQKSFYLKNFHACRNYQYYMELQILRFSKAVQTKTIFKPLNLPRRHEDRY